MVDINNINMQYHFFLCLMLINKTSVKNEIDVLGTYES